MLLLLLLSLNLSVDLSLSLWLSLELLELLLQHLTVSIGERQVSRLRVVLVVVQLLRVISDGQRDLGLLLELLLLLVVVEEVLLLLLLRERNGSHQSGGRSGGSGGGLGLPLPGLDLVLLHGERTVHLVQLEVEAARVADGLP